LSFGINGVPILLPDAVIDIIVGNLAIKHGQHSAARAETLSIASATGVIVLRLPLDIERVRKPGY
jgi:hypothetical protein